MARKIASWYDCNNLTYPPLIHQPADYCPTKREIEIAGFNINYLGSMRPSDSLMPIDFLSYTNRTYLFTMEFSNIINQSYISTADGVLKIKALNAQQNEMGWEIEARSYSKTVLAENLDKSSQVVYYIGIENNTGKRITVSENNFFSNSWALYNNEIRYIETYLYSQIDNTSEFKLMFEVLVDYN